MAALRAPFFEQGADTRSAPTNAARVRALCDPHLHVAPRRVLAGDGRARGHAAAAERRDPARPVLPPRALVLRGAGEPGRWVVRQLLGAGPVAVFLRGRRIDDAGDMARGAEHEAHRAAEQAR